MNIKNLKSFNMINMNNILFDTIFQNIITKLIYLICKYIIFNQKDYITLFNKYIRDI